MSRLRLAVLTALPVLLTASAAGAWGIGSELHHDGCHERITAQALRNARMRVATAPAIAMTRNERALVDGVQFSPPSDFKNDLAGMALLLGVRDNDLKGNDPLDSLQLVEVHGDPNTQNEHCIRGRDDDGSDGNESALGACRQFIVARAMEALDGLGADGVVDPTRRIELQVNINIRGAVDPMLPLFYVRIGQAAHALEDGFTHTYRSDDGGAVTVVMNWIEAVDGTPPDEGRDGPPHLAQLDQCDNKDPLVQRNYALAVEAATELFTIALDSSLSREAKRAAFDALTARYLSYRPGCTDENDWCSAREPDVASMSGCNVGGRAGAIPWVSIVLILGALTRAGRYRMTVVPLLAGVLLAGTAHADDPPPAPAPVSAPDATAKPEAPVVPIEAAKPEDVKDVVKGEEPGRDVKTPTVEEIQQVREDKRLGSKWGFTAVVGGSFVHGAGAVGAGARYRINERWLVGADVEWNPWVVSQPIAAKAGAANAYLTLVRRFPMKFDRVNLRMSVHAGVSTLLFDVYGAQKFDIGPYAAFTPLGIDYDLGNAVRLVIDPVQIAVPVPHVGMLPLYYEQFRLMIALQVGA